MTDPTCIEFDDVVRLWGWFEPELFIRAVAAHDVSCLMEYRGLSLQEAMEIVVHEKLMAIGGEGGMIGVDAQGNAALVFNSQGMYRGYKSSDGASTVAIYK